jgi:hypothetical protein
MRKNRVKLFFASTMALMLAFESPVAFAIPVQAQAEETSSDFNYPSGKRYSVLTAGITRLLFMRVIFTRITIVLICLRQYPVIPQ